LGDLVETTSGGTPFRGNAEYYINGNIYWVKSKELNSSFIINTEEKITTKALNESSAKIFPAYSVLIAMYGNTVGEYGIVSKPMSCNQAVCAMIPNEKFPFTYLFFLIKSLKTEFINNSVGSAQQNISQVLIKNTEIVYFENMILEFHTKVNSFMNKILINTEQIQTLTKTRDELLPRLMSGEVRVIL
jgi:type I restriction enzyme S subunit